MRKFALTYPPEFDGELHVMVTDQPHGQKVLRTITVEISVDSEENPRDTIRKLGADMTNQPIRARHAS